MKRISRGSWYCPDVWMNIRTWKFDQFCQCINGGCHIENHDVSSSKIKSSIFNCHGHSLVNLLTRGLHLWSSRLPVDVLQRRRRSRWEAASLFLLASRSTWAHISALPSRSKSCSLFCPEGGNLNYTFLGWYEKKFLKLVPRGTYNRRDHFIIPIHSCLWCQGQSFYPQKQLFFGSKKKTRDKRTDRRIDGPADGRTRPFIEMRSRIKKPVILTPSLWVKLRLHFSHLQSFGHEVELLTNVFWHL